MKVNNSSNHIATLCLVPQINIYVPANMKIENLKLSLIEMENSLAINLSATIVKVQTWKIQWELYLKLCYKNVPDLKLNLWEIFENNL